MAGGVHVGNVGMIVGYANTFHDPAVAFVDGERVFAEALERHSQCKQSMGNTLLWYSQRSLSRSMVDMGFAVDGDSPIVARTSWKINLRTTLQLVPSALRGSALSRRADLAIFGFQLAVLTGLATFRKQIWGVFTDQPDALFLERVPVKTKKTSHHLAHAAAAVYTSDLTDCVVMIIDGTSEAHSTSFYHFKDNGLKLLSRSVEADSLGLLYARMTHACGFVFERGEEWKVMGLAAYGSYRPEIYDFFWSHTKIKGLKVRLKFSERKFKQLEQIVGGFRDSSDPDAMKSADLAHNFQRYFTEVVIKLAQAASKLGLSKNLAYAGGAALNSSTNGQILVNTGFERLHIPCAPADDGNALGAALYEQHVVRGAVRTPASASPYLGSDIDRENLKRIVDGGGVKHREMSDESVLCKEIAKLLAAGEIVGWMQGRAEFGPRALGNRSILADPRSVDIKDRVNSMVKFREAFRPLAPAVLHEYGPDYFESYQESRYMERTLKFRDEVRSKVPGVVHVDGTGRLQTVKEAWNQRYYRLIRAFFDETGIPIVLNTSFNVKGKPIVHSVEDAITVFYTTALPYLVIDNYLLYK